MSQNKEEKHIVELLMEYALSLGVRRINEFPGLWEHKVDEHWTIRCNGHLDSIDNVPGFCWAVEFNGWPAGILSVVGEGVLCAGSEGNEDALRSAIKKQMIPLKN